MDLTQEQLKNSVFYPACGFDLNPIKHLTLFNTFIYCEWKAVNQRNFDHEFTEAVNSLDSNLTIKEIEDVTIPRFTDDNFPSGFAFTKDELSKRELEQRRGRPWGKKVALEKRDETAQLINLYYFGKVEGLRLYSNLYQSGQSAPRVLVTVNSGSGLGGGFAKFEAPGGVTKRFMKYCNTKPLIWIRGGMGKNEPPAPGFYDEHIRDFENWYDYQVQAFCEKQHRTEAEQLFSKVP